MNEAYYQTRINQVQQQIYGIEDAIREKEKDLDYLYQFKEEHQKSIRSIEQNFQQRSDRLNRTSINATKVKIFQSYSKSMTDLLQQKQQYLQKKNDEQSEISRGIDRLLNELEELRRQRFSYEDQLSDLYYRLRLERMKVNDK
ncbi:hypothetical protein [Enterococcus wangshanyuanii]|uniref:DUF5082 domain-containing protein n=1 Tax=Enterococcus wangshanyuanii TaxID=2005703 RepID=A0ABQ1P7S8_9ENTE|nr:hypothetical protein [Enterococcus wangshanyuanii]GGC91050.1 hypothetical protein GCM10011573_20810 [Enterococcus wangshanyuanii]